jgi:hypothetical protein
MSELSPDEPSIAAAGADPGRRKAVAHEASSAATSARSATPIAGMVEAMLSGAIPVEVGTAELARRDTVPSAERRRAFHRERKRRASAKAPSAESQHAPPPNAERTLERIAIERWQIEEWNLPTRPTKTSNTSSKSFGDISVELDAINPDRLRSLVATAIENHLPKQQFTILKAAEEREREIIRQLVGDDLNGGRSVPWGRSC